MVRTINDRSPWQASVNWRVRTVSLPKEVSNLAYIEKGARYSSRRAGDAGTPFRKPARAIRTTIIVVLPCLVPRGPRGGRGTGSMKRSYGKSITV
eukprot:3530010-Amphidinium_carterae.1